MRDARNGRRTPQRIGISVRDVRSHWRPVLKHGHDVLVGTRHVEKLADWRTENPKAVVGSFADAAASAEVVVLAVKGTAASDALRQAGGPNLDGKVVIDATNPIADAPPDHGVLKFFTSLDDSLMERLQREFPVRVCQGVQFGGHDSMVNPQLEGGPPTMFICGNHDAASGS